VATGDVDTALRIYVALYELALFQGVVEIFDWLEPAVRRHRSRTGSGGAGHVRPTPRSAQLGVVGQAVAALKLYAQGGMRNHRLLYFSRGSPEASRGNLAAADGLSTVR
jgi:hypothetical protein